MQRVRFADDHVELLDSYYKSKQSHQLQYQQKYHHMKQLQQELKQQQQIVSEYQSKNLKRILVIVLIMLVLQLSSYFGGVSTSDRNNHDDSSSVLSRGIAEEGGAPHPSLSERRAVWEGEYGQSDWSRVPPHLQGYYSKFNRRYDSGREAERQSPTRIVKHAQEKDRHRRYQQQTTEPIPPEKASNLDVILSVAGSEEQQHQQAREQNVKTITDGTADDDIVGAPKLIEGSLLIKGKGTQTRRAQIQVHITSPVIALNFC